MTISVHDAFVLIRDRFLDAKISHNKRDIIITCIRCEKTNHLSITPVKNLVHCYKCGYADTMTNFFKETDIKSQIYEESVHDIDFNSKIKKLELVEITLPQGHRYLPDDSMMGSIAMRYLMNKRKMSKENIIKYKLGYCSLGSFGGRVIVPVYENGILVYYEGKAFLGGMYKKTKNPHREIDEKDKIKGEEYIKNGKSQVVFNIDRAKMHERCVITEGAFDAISIGDEAVALLGKEISEIQFYKILKCKFKEYIIMLDGDAHENTLELAKRFSQYAKVKAVLLPKGDPDEYSDVVIEDMIVSAPYFSDIYYIETMINRL